MCDRVPEVGRLCRPSGRDPYLYDCDAKKGKMAHSCSEYGFETSRNMWRVPLDVGRRPEHLPEAERVNPLDVAASAMTPLV